MDHDPSPNQTNTFNGHRRRKELIAMMLRVFYAIDVI